MVETGAGVLWGFWVSELVASGVPSWSEGGVVCCSEDGDGVVSSGGSVESGVEACVGSPVGCPVGEPVEEGVVPEPAGVAVGCPVLPSPLVGAGVWGGVSSSDTSVESGVALGMGVPVESALVGTGAVPEPVGAAVGCGASSGSGVAMGSGVFSSGGSVGNGVAETVESGPGGLVASGVVELVESGVLSVPGIAVVGIGVAAEVGMPPSSTGGVGVGGDSSEGAGVNGKGVGDEGLSGGSVCWPLAGVEAAVLTAVWSLFNVQHPGTAARPGPSAAFSDTQALTPPSNSTKPKPSLQGTHSHRADVLTLILHPVHSQSQPHDLVTNCVVGAGHSSHAFFASFQTESEHRQPVPEAVGNEP
mmetsp:Transcript_1806/g.5259  ORF Transcript_1806/g.5259 Transcript_1806/m.5259 type:complete len:360 (-) Transcript_1806:246-1325(-)